LSGKKGRPESGHLFQIRRQHLRSISSLRGLGANDVAKLRPWSYHQRMNMSPPSDYVAERRGAFKSAQVNAFNKSIGVPLMMGECRRGCTWRASGKIRCICLVTPRNGR
jgi:hypothetical protein